MAPYYPSRYQENEAKFNEVRRMFIELDKFVVKSEYETCWLEIFNDVNVGIA